MTILTPARLPGRAGRDPRAFLLQRAQPAMNGLIDGSLSTLAPIFAVAFATHQPHYAFFAGLATALGADVSMAFSEGLSDTGDLTGRGNSFLRGKITGAGTFLGGILHTLPFLIPAYHAALAAALATIVFELVALAWIRWRFFATGFLRSFISIAIGGAIIASVSPALGAVSQLPSNHTPSGPANTDQEIAQWQSTCPAIRTLTTGSCGLTMVTCMWWRTAGRARPAC